MVSMKQPIKSLSHPCQVDADLSVGSMGTVQQPSHCPFAVLRVWNICTCKVPTVQIELAVVLWSRV